MRVPPTVRDVIAETEPEPSERCRRTKECLNEVNRRCASATRQAMRIGCMYCASGFALPCTYNSGAQKTVRDLYVQGPRRTVQAGLQEPVWRSDFWLETVNETNKARGSQLACLSGAVRDSNAGEAHARRGWGSARP